MPFKGGERKAVSDSFPNIIEFNKELMKERGLTKEDVLALAGNNGLLRWEEQALLGGLGLVDGLEEDLLLVYSPWVKYCGIKQAAGARSCFLATEVRTRSGVPVMAASLIERDRPSKRGLRITLPAPLQLRYGARAIIDEDLLMRARFFTCYANACMADFPITTEVARKFRKAQTLTIEAIGIDGAPVSFHLPMASYRESRDGPATDVKLFEEQQREFLVKLGNRAVAQQAEVIDVPRTHFAASAGTKVALSKLMASFWAPLSRVVTSTADASAAEDGRFLAEIRGAVFWNTVAEWRDELGPSQPSETTDNSPNKRRDEPGSNRFRGSEVELSNPSR